MSENTIQTSFSAGELAPSLTARVDLSKYRSGAATMRNFFVDYRSGTSTRFGSRFVIQALISSKPVRAYSFQYSISNTFIIEMGDQYFRFISNGGAVLETAFNLSGASNGNPGVLTAVGNNFVNGDWIFVQGIAGATGYNGKFYLVTVSGSAITLQDVNGTSIDASAFGAYTTGGTAARVYTLATPYLAADLFSLKFTQSASVLTITHASYAPRNLTQVSAANWTLTTTSFGTSILAPTGLGTSATAVGTANFSYIVTAVDNTGQESLASAPVAANNVVNITTTAGSITVTWAAVTGAVKYNVYKATLNMANPVPTGAAFGFVGDCTGTTFIDSNAVPDFTDQAPTLFNPFAAGNNPICVTYFQQREVYGSSTANPLNLWFSQPGQFNNFNKSDPVQDSDSITVTLISDQVNAIKAMKAMPGGLIVLTAKGAWQVNGGSGGAGGQTAITPASVLATPQAYNGCSDVPPVVAVNDILYVQAKGSIVRSLSYNIYANIYTGMDISVLSNHLFASTKITDWAWAEEPYKIVWAVRDDGILLSLTYLKEQEIFGWARHDTKGLYQSVASATETSSVLPNVTVDAVYAVVKRFIQGRWVQYIERFADRAFIYGAEDTWAVDAGVQSTLTMPAAGLTASASSGTGVTFSADSPVFTAGQVGFILRMGGGIATITAFVSAMQVTGTITQAISAVIPNDLTLTPVPAAAGYWSLAQSSTTFSGLDHLNGQSVSILADGGVVSPQVVVNGSITLPKAASKVVAGLGYTCQLQTMYLDVGEPTIQGKRKKVNALTIRLSQTRGLNAGRTFDTLAPVKELYSTTILNQASPLITGDERTIMDALWNIEGQICIQVSDPLPATILGVIPEITIGDSAK